MRGPEALLPACHGGEEGRKGRRGKVQNTLISCSRPRERRKGRTKGVFFGRARNQETHGSLFTFAADPGCMGRKREKSPSIADTAPA